MGCWVVEMGLAPAGSCDGRLIRAHLIPKQRIAREIGESFPRRMCVTRAEMRERDEKIRAVMWDGRCWRWVCGGPTGIGGHHGMLDYSRTITIPRAVLPLELEEFAAEYGLEWSLERDYGRKV